MEQNFIINFANEVINNLYFDISNNSTSENSTYLNNFLTNENITTQVNDVSSTTATIFTPYTLRPYTLRPYTFRPYTFRPYTFRPLNINNIDTHPYASILSNYSQNIMYASTFDLSYITLDSINTNYPRTITLRDLLRTLYLNYYEEDDNNTSLETFINSTFENKTKIKKVIADSELEKLKPQKFNKINETTTNIECPILCYNFEENEEIIKLPCNHNYNCHAILKWLSEESNTCPVCRHEFDYKEINIDNKRQIHEQEQSSTQNVETTNIHNLFSNEEILMQEILLNAYSNSNV